MRSKALFDIEALLREQPRQVRIDFEERVVRLDFAANQVRAAQPCGRAGRKRRSRVVCRNLPKYLAQNICFYFIHVPTKAAVMCRFSFGVTLPPASFSRRRAKFCKANPQLLPAAEMRKKSSYFNLRLNHYRAKVPV